MLYIRDWLQGLVLVIRYGRWLSGSAGLGLASTYHLTPLLVVIKSFDPSGPSGSPFKPVGLFWTAANWLATASSLWPATSPGGIGSMRVGLVERGTLLSLSRIVSGASWVSPLAALICALRFKRKSLFVDAERLGSAVCWARYCCCSGVNGCPCAGACGCCGWGCCGGCPGAPGACPCCAAFKTWEVFWLAISGAAPFLTIWLIGTVLTPPPFM